MNGFGVLSILFSVSWQFRQNIALYSGVDEASKLMSAPADQTPSSLDARTHTSTSSSKRTSSIVVFRSRIRSASYVFALGLFSQATATRSFFSREMYVRSIGPPLDDLSRNLLINASPCETSVANSLAIALGRSAVRVGESALVLEISG